MQPSPRLDLIALAERQLGLVTISQVQAAGWSESAWRHAVSRGEWSMLTARVARRRGSPPSAEQRALGAVLDMGGDSLLCHWSGVALWGHPGYRLEPLQVMTLRGHRTTSTIATVHRPRHLPEPFAAVLRGVPVVRPSLLMLQMAPFLHTEQLARLFDWFWSRRLLSAESVRHELEPIMGRGRPGTAALRELLDRLPADYVPSASSLESRFVRILLDFGLPPMRRQVDLGDGEAWCGRVDFLAIDLPLIAEIDSDTYHGALTSKADDEQRQARLEAAGFDVMRVTEFQVWHRPAEVAATVRAARSRTRARVRAQHPNAAA